MSDRIRARELYRRVARLEAENARLRQELADALHVTSRDGLLSSEWVLRTGKAERERDAALAEVAKLKAKVARWEMSYELATGALSPLAPLAKMVVQGFFVECMPERAGGSDV